MLLKVYCAITRWPCLFICIRSVEFFALLQNLFCVVFVAAFLREDKPLSYLLHTPDLAPLATAAAAGAVAGGGCGAAAAAGFKQMLLIKQTDAGASAARLRRE